MYKNTGLDINRRTGKSDAVSDYYAFTVIGADDIYENVYLLNIARKSEQSTLLMTYWHGNTTYLDFGFYSENTEN